MPAVHEQIAALEAEIEELREAADRCRKIGVVAKGAVVLGLVLLFTGTLGLPQPRPIAFVVAITALLGGIALHGSNRSTQDRIMARVRVHEAQRAEMIDGLGLRGGEEASAM